MRCCTRQIARFHFCANCSRTRKPDEFVWFTFWGSSLSASAAVRYSLLSPLVFPWLYYGWVTIPLFWIRPIFLLRRKLVWRCDDSSPLGFKNKQLFIKRMQRVFDFTAILLKKTRTRTNDIPWKRKWRLACLRGEKSAHPFAADGLKIRSRPCFLLEKTLELFFSNRKRVLSLDEIRVITR